jgi:hypothetical protein
MHSKHRPSGAAQGARKVYEEPPGDAATYMADPIDTAPDARDTGRRRTRKAVGMSVTRTNELARARAAISGSATRELAGVRCEAAALRRENDRLRARLARLEDSATPGSGATRDLPAGPLWCSRCGLTAKAWRDADAVLVLAGCCPHCDGRLVPGDPSTYLG